MGAQSLALRVIGSLIVSSVPDAIAALSISRRARRGSLAATAPPATAICTRAWWLEAPALIHAATSTCTLALRSSLGLIGWLAAGLMPVTKVAGIHCPIVLIISEGVIGGPFYSHHFFSAIVVKQNATPRVSLFLENIETGQFGGPSYEHALRSFYCRKNIAKDPLASSLPSAGSRSSMPARARQALAKRPHRVCVCESGGNQDIAIRLTSRLPSTDEIFTIAGYRASAGSCSRTCRHSSDPLETKSPIGILRRKSRRRGRLEGDRLYRVAHARA